MKKHIKQHIANILSQFEPQLNYGLKSRSLGSQMKMYFKDNKGIKRDEKSGIVDLTYKLMREKTMIEHVAQNKNPKWIDLIYTYLSNEYRKQKKDTSIKDQVRLSCPPFLYDKLHHQYGYIRTNKYCEVNISEPPVTIRNNPFKITRQQLHDQLYQQYRLRFINGKASEYALILNADCKFNHSLYELDEFQDGLFEIQDEGSQLAALQVQCKPNQTVIDYCAGAGGKSLLYAYAMKVHLINACQNKGRLILHDVNSQQLKWAKQRLKRAGVINADYVNDRTNIKRKSADWLILDVPCSGTGVLRRNPDTKYKLIQTELDELVRLQREIIDESLQYVKRKEGKVVYITCSLLEEENQQQVKYMMEKHKMELENNNYLQIFPQMNGMDSLFAATLYFK